MTSYHNNNCGGDHCTERTQYGPVRRLPTGGDGAVILCWACYEYELAWRRRRNQELGEAAQFKLPRWHDLPIYSEKG